MNDDDVDAWLKTAPLAAPPGFAARLTELVRVTPQLPAPPTIVRPWQWAALGAAAGFGALQLCEFVFVAFAAVGAQ